MIRSATWFEGLMAPPHRAVLSHAWNTRSVGNVRAVPNLGHRAHFRQMRSVPTLAQHAIIGYNNPYIELQGGYTGRGQNRALVEMLVIGGYPRGPAFRVLPRTQEFGSRAQWRLTQPQSVTEQQVSRPDVGVLAFASALRRIGD